MFYNYIEVKAFVEDVSPALLATIEQEFEKVSKMDPPQPTKAPTGAVRFLFENASNECNFDLLFFSLVQQLILETMEVPALMLSNHCSLALIFRGH